MFILGMMDRVAESFLGGIREPSPPPLHSKVCPNSPDYDPSYVPKKRVLKIDVPYPADMSAFLNGPGVL